MTKTFAFFLLAAAAVITAHAKEPQQKTRPTEYFRREHVEIQKLLSETEKTAGDLATMSAAEQKNAMQKIVAFFEGHIKPHAQWEERKLYPAVDRRAARGKNVFTSTMRYEHQIVGRWASDLAQEAKKPSPDVKLFARKTDQLLGLIRAHFEEEEEVLLPVLDKSMTASQFKEEIMDDHGH